MNKNLLIAGAVVIIVAVGAFLFINNSSNNTSSSNNNDSLGSEAEQLVMSAFEGAGSVKCTYHDEVSMGTFYVKNGMVRAETTSPEEQGQDGNFILKNDTVWIWQTGATEGYMMTNISKYQSDPNVPDGYSVDEESVRQNIEENQAECNSENIDDSLFEAPQDVVFTDFSSTIENIQNQMPSEIEIPEGITLPEGYEIPGN